MKRKILGMIMVAALSVSMLAGCTGNQEAAPEVTETEAAPEAATEEAAEAAAEEPANEAALEDGVYSAKFTTDGSMFHINEAYGDRGTLTVKDGQMTIHIIIGRTSQSKCCRQVFRQRYRLRRIENVLVSGIFCLLRYVYNIFIMKST